MQYARHCRKHWRALLLFYLGSYIGKRIQGGECDDNDGPPKSAKQRRVMTPIKSSASKSKKPAKGMSAAHLVRLAKPKVCTGDESAKPKKTKSRSHHKAPSSRDQSATPTGPKSKVDESTRVISCSNRKISAAQGICIRPFEIDRGTGSSYIDGTIISVAVAGGGGNDSDADQMSYQSRKSETQDKNVTSVGQKKEASQSPKRYSLEDLRSQLEEELEYTRSRKHRQHKLLAKSRSSHELTEFKLSGKDESSSPPFFDHFVDRKMDSIFMPNDAFARSKDNQNIKEVPSPKSLHADPLGPSALPSITRIPKLALPAISHGADEVCDFSPIGISPEIQEMAENTLFLFDDMQRHRERKARVPSKDTDAGKTELRLLDADFQNFKAIRVPKICAVLHQLAHKYNLGPDPLSDSRLNRLLFKRVADLNNGHRNVYDLNIHDTIVSAVRHAYVRTYASNDVGYYHHHLFGHMPFHSHGSTGSHLPQKPFQPISALHSAFQKPTTYDPFRAGSCENEDKSKYHEPFCRRHMMPTSAPIRPPLKSGSPRVVISKSSLSSFHVMDGITSPPPGPSTNDVVATTDSTLINCNVDIEKQHREYQLLLKEYQQQLLEYQRAQIENQLKQHQGLTKEPQPLPQPQPEIAEQAQPQPQEIVDKSSTNSLCRGDLILQQLKQQKTPSIPPASTIIPPASTIIPPASTIIPPASTIIPPSFGSQQALSSLHICESCTDSSLCGVTPRSNITSPLVIQHPKFPSRHAQCHKQQQFPPLRDNALPGAGGYYDKPRELPAGAHNQKPSPALSILDPYAALTKPIGGPMPGELSANIPASVPCTCTSRVYFAGGEDPPSARRMHRTVPGQKYQPQTNSYLNQQEYLSKQNYNQYQTNKMHQHQCHQEQPYQLNQYQHPSEHPSEHPSQHPSQHTLQNLSHYSSHNMSQHPSQHRMQHRGFQNSYHNQNQECNRDQHYHHKRSYDQYHQNYKNDCSNSQSHDIARPSFHHRIDPKLNFEEVVRNPQLNHRKVHTEQYPQKSQSQYQQRRLGNQSGYKGNMGNRQQQSIPYNDAPILEHENDSTTEYNAPHPSHYANYHERPQYGNTPPQHDDPCSVKYNKPNYDKVRSPEFHEPKPQEYYPKPSTTYEDELPAKEQQHLHQEAHQLNQRVLDLTNQGNNNTSSYHDPITHQNYGYPQGGTWDRDHVCRHSRKEPWVNDACRTPKVAEEEHINDAISFPGEVAPYCEDRVHHHSEYQHNYHHQHNLYGNNQDHNAGGYDDYSSRTGCQDSISDQHEFSHVCTNECHDHEHEQPAYTQHQNNLNCNRVYNLNSRKRASGTELDYYAPNTAPEIAQETEICSPINSYNSEPCSLPPEYVPSPQVDASPPNVDNSSRLPNVMNPAPVPMLDPRQKPTRQRAHTPLSKHIPHHMINTFVPGCIKQSKPSPDSISPTRISPVSANSSAIGKYRGTYDKLPPPGYRPEGPRKVPGTHKRPFTPTLPNLDMYLPPKDTQVKMPSSANMKRRRSNSVGAPLSARSASNTSKKSAPGARYSTSNTSRKSWHFGKTPAHVTRKPSSASRGGCSPPHPHDSEVHGRFNENNSKQKISFCNHVEKHAEYQKHPKKNQHEHYKQDSKRHKPNLNAGCEKPGKNQADAKFKFDGKGHDNSAKQSLKNLSKGQKIQINLEHIIQGKKLGMAVPTAEIEACEFKPRRQPRDRPCHEEQACFSIDSNSPTNSHGTPCSPTCNDNKCGMTAEVMRANFPTNSEPSKQQYCDQDSQQSCIESHDCQSQICSPCNKLIEHHEQPIRQSMYQDPVQCTRANHEPAKCANANIEPAKCASGNYELVKCASGTYDSPKWPNENYEPAKCPSGNFEPAKWNSDNCEPAKCASRNHDLGKCASCSKTNAMTSPHMSQEMFRNEGCFREKTSNHSVSTSPMPSRSQCDKCQRCQHNQIDREHIGHRMSQHGSHHTEQSMAHHTTGQHINQHVCQDVGQHMSQHASHHMGQRVGHNMSHPTSPIIDQHVSQNKIQHMGQDVGQCMSQHKNQDRSQHMSQDRNQHTSQHMGPNRSHNMGQDRSHHTGQDMGQRMSQHTSHHMGQRMGHMSHHVSQDIVQPVSQHIGQDIGQHISQNMGQHTGLDMGKQMSHHTSQDMGRPTSQDMGKHKGQDVGHHTNQDVDHAKLCHLFRDHCKIDHCESTANDQTCQGHSDEDCHNVDCHVQEEDGDALLLKCYDHIAALAAGGQSEDNSSFVGQTPNNSRELSAITNARLIVVDAASETDSIESPSSPMPDYNPPSGSTSSKALCSLPSRAMIRTSSGKIRRQGWRSIPIGKEETDAIFVRGSIYPPSSSPDATESNSGVPSSDSDFIKGQIKVVEEKNRTRKVQSRKKSTVLVNLEDLLIKKVNMVDTSCSAIVLEKPADKKENKSSLLLTKKNIAKDEFIQECMDNKRLRLLREPLTYSFHKPVTKVSAGTSAYCPNEPQVTKTLVCADTNTSVVDIKKLVSAATSNDNDRILSKDRLEGQSQTFAEVRKVLVSQISNMIVETVHNNSEVVVHEVLDDETPSKSDIDVTLHSFTVVTDPSITLQPAVDSVASKSAVNIRSSPPRKFDEQFSPVQRQGPNELSNECPGLRNQQTNLDPNCVETNNVQPVAQKVPESQPPKRDRLHQQLTMRYENAPDCNGRYLTLQVNDQFEATSLFVNQSKRKSKPLPEKMRLTESSILEHETVQQVTSYKCESNKQCFCNEEKTQVSQPRPKKIGKPPPVRVLCDKPPTSATGEKVEGELYSDALCAGADSMDARMTLVCSLNTLHEDFIPPQDVAIEVIPGSSLFEPLSCLGQCCCHNSSYDADLCNYEQYFQQPMFINAADNLSGDSFRSFPAEEDSYKNQIDVFDKANQTQNSGSFLNSYGSPTYTQTSTQGSSMEESGNQSSMLSSNSAVVNAIPAVFVREGICYLTQDDLECFHSSINEAVEMTEVPQAVCLCHNDDLFQSTIPSPMPLTASRCPCDEPVRIIVSTSRNEYTSVHDTIEGTSMAGEHIHMCSGGNPSRTSRCMDSPKIKKSISCATAPCTPLPCNTGPCTPLARTLIKDNATCTSPKALYSTRNSGCNSPQIKCTNSSKGWADPTSYLGRRKTGSTMTNRFMRKIHEQRILPGENFYNAFNQFAPRKWTCRNGMWCSQVPNETYCRTYMHQHCSPGQVMACYRADVFHNYIHHNQHPSITLEEIKPDQEEEQVAYVTVPPTNFNSYTVEDTQQKDRESSFAKKSKRFLGKVKRTFSTILESPTISKKRFRTQRAGSDMDYILESSSGSEERICENCDKPKVTIRCRDKGQETPSIWLRDLEVQKKEKRKKAMQKLREKRKKASKHPKSKTKMKKRPKWRGPLDSTSPDSTTTCEPTESEVHMSSSSSPPPKKQIKRKPKRQRKIKRTSYKTVQTSKLEVLEQGTDPCAISPANVTSVLPPKTKRERDNWKNAILNNEMNWTSSTSSTLEEEFPPNLRYVMHESEQRYTRNPLIISEYGLLKQRAESRKRAGSFFDSPVDSERFKTNYFLSDSESTSSSFKMENKYNFKRYNRKRGKRSPIHTSKSFPDNLVKKEENLLAIKDFKNFRGLYSAAGHNGPKYNTTRKHKRLQDKRKKIQKRSPNISTPQNEKDENSILELYSPDLLNYVTNCSSFESQVLEVGKTKIGDVTPDDSKKAKKVKKVQEKTNKNKFKHDYYLDLNDDKLDLTDSQFSQIVRQLKRGFKVRVQNLEDLQKLTNDNKKQKKNKHEASKKVEEAELETKKPRKHHKAPETTMQYDLNHGDKILDRKYYNKKIEEMTAESSNNLIYENKVKENLTDPISVLKERQHKKQNVQQVEQIEAPKKERKSHKKKEHDDVPKEVDNKNIVEEPIKKEDLEHPHKQHKKHNVDKDPGPHQTVHQKHEGKHVKSYEDEEVVVVKKPADKHDHKYKTHKVNMPAEEAPRPEVHKKYQEDVAENHRLKHKHRYDLDPNFLSEKLHEAKVLQEQLMPNNREETINDEQIWSSIEVNSDDSSTVIFSDEDVGKPIEIQESNSGNLRAGSEEFKPAIENENKEETYSMELETTCDGDHSYGYCSNMYDDQDNTSLDNFVCVGGYLDEPCDDTEMFQSIRNYDKYEEYDDIPKSEYDFNLADEKISKAVFESSKEQTDKYSNKHKHYSLADLDDLNPDPKYKEKFDKAFRNQFKSPPAKRYEITSDEKLMEIPDDDKISFLKSYDGSLRDSSKDTSICTHFISDAADSEYGTLDYGCHGSSSHYSCLHAHDYDDSRVKSMRSVRFGSDVMVRYDEIISSPGSMDTVYSPSLSAKQNSVDDISALSKQDYAYYRLDEITYDSNRFRDASDCNFLPCSRNKSASSPSIPPKSRLAMKLQNILGFNSLDHESRGSFGQSSSLIKLSSLSRTKTRKRRTKNAGCKVISVIAPPKEMPSYNSMGHSNSEIWFNQERFNRFSKNSLKSRCSSFFLHPQPITSSVSLFLKNEQFFQKLCKQFNDTVRNEEDFSEDNFQAWDHAASSTAVDEVKSHVALRQAEGSLELASRQNTPSEVAMLKPKDMNSISESSNGINNSSKMINNIGSNLNKRSFDLRQSIKRKRNPARRSSWIRLLRHSLAPRIKSTTAGTTATPTIAASTNPSNPCRRNLNIVHQLSEPISNRPLRQNQNLTPAFGNRTVADANHMSSTTNNLNTNSTNNSNCYDLRAHDTREEQQRQLDAAKHAARQRLTKF